VRIFAKVLSDVRSLDGQIRLQNRGRDPTLLRKDRVHRPSEPTSFKLQRRAWTSGSEVEVLDQKLGKWLRAEVEKVTKGQDGDSDVLAVRVTDTDPRARYQKMVVNRDDTSQVRPRTGNRLKKLTDSRQARHDARLDLYRKVRDAVATQLQMEAGLVCRKMRSSNANIERQIAELLESMSDKKLGALTMDDLEQVLILNSIKIGVAPTVRFYLLSFFCIP
jgi:hypothetical protein